MKEKLDEMAVPRFAPRPRRGINCSEDLVRFEPLSPRPLPMIARPAMSGVDLVGWAKTDLQRIRANLLAHGAILFRGFDVRTTADFEDFIKATSGELLPYVERSSPRSPVAGNIYSSTEYPPEHEIFLHCENSYQKSWPLKIFFYCQSPAEQGGETPIADTRRILGRINQSVYNKFSEKGVMYVRNFGTGLGLPWQTVFQTEDRSVVEQYCSNAGIECTWIGAHQLRTTQVRKAIQLHPITGEAVWFNHAVFFHVSTLDPTLQQVLQASVPEEDLPNQTYYGDGSAIEAEVLDHLRTAYREETVHFLWQRGDILMLDNMLTAHGRAAYQGGRKILVGMAELYSA